MNEIKRDSDPRHEQDSVELRTESTDLPRIHFMVALDSDKLEHTFPFTVRYDGGGRKSVAVGDNPANAALNGVTPTIDLLHQAHQFFIQHEAKIEGSKRAGYYGALGQMDSSRQGTLGPPPPISPAHGSFELCWNQDDPQTIFVRRQRG